MVRNMVKLQNKQEDYRFEYKFVIPFQDKTKILYNPQFLRHFILDHPSRFINNLYFDDIQRSSFWENIDGISNRTKYRVRWYGKQFGIINPTAELKIKSDTANKKKSLHLGETEYMGLEHTGSFSLLLKDRLLEKNNSDFNIWLTLMPTLINRYYRAYYIAKNSYTRLTIDTQLSFYNPQRRAEKIFNDIIVEIKSNVANPIYLDYLPLQVDKSSKYVIGSLT